jgi:hypothetical protein
MPKGVEHCRFLMLASHRPYDVRPIVEQFAHMCQGSAEHNGDWQGDGWGVAWGQEPGAWRLYRSLAPIWTETAVMQRLPLTRQLVVHARSASFAEHKGNVAYNQPYVHDTYAFVFNGLIKGVRLPRHVPGAIGAEKIWYLVRARLQQGVPPPQALQQVYALLARQSREIRGCNMGLSNGTEYWVWNGNPSGRAYYQLHHAQHGGLRMVCSAPFGAWAWRT